MALCGTHSSKGATEPVLVLRLVIPATEETLGRRTTSQGPGQSVKGELDYNSTFWESAAGGLPLVQGWLELYRKF